MATGARSRTRAERDAARALADVARRLEPEVGELSSRLTEHLFAEIPELDRELFADMTAAVRASLVAWLGMVKRGLPAAAVTPPEDVLQLARAWVARGTPLAVLLRAYRLGHGFVVREWLGALEDSESLNAPLVERLLELSFAYIDAMSAHVAESYALERARWTRSADAARADTVRQIVAGAAVDTDAASAVLGYELRRWHVGLVLSADERDEPMRRLETAAAEIADVLGSARPLLVPAARSVVWAWCGSAEAPAAAALAALAGGRRRREGVGVALGEPGEGLRGFARSHGEALESARVAALGGRSGAVTRYADVDLLALLTRDLERARAFAASELRSLSGDDDATARLRATLGIYLEEGRSFVATARRLGIHENTVKYRVRRCEELLGRAVGERPLKLAAAILLARVLS